MDQDAPADTPECEPLAALIEDYLTGRIDELRLSELEERLRDDPEARREFVRYARLHTDLHFELRAREASERVLDEIDRKPPADPRPSHPQLSFFRRRILALAAAAILLAAGLLWWAVRPGVAEVAWLVNAQNCTWAGGEPPTDLRPGKVIAINRGLAEFRFQSGARVVLEGPAQLEMISGTSARLYNGKLAVRVSGKTGFEILSPQGRVADRGTEFGVSVSEAGATDVHVFEGSVEVVPTGAGAAAVSLTQAQTARITAGTVTVRPEPGPEGFIRAIVPPPLVIPRTMRLTFDGFASAGIRDDAGVTTGFTYRLPGTGTTLPSDDLNLRLDSAKGQLELTTTNTDLNTQYRLWEGEYLGVRLTDLGFTGSEDFAVSVTFLNIPALEIVGQFGLYAGSASDQTIRGGLINSRRTESGQYTQFLVTNQDGKDASPHKVGLLETGSDLRMTLRRAAGKFTLTVENLTTSEESTLTPRGHPAFLDPVRDLYVGVFGANTQSEIRRTLVIKDFRATVWTVAPPPGD
jgi:ferric-dicitrate binding protein FerR (iron transport regulator)